MLFEYLDQPVSFFYVHFISLLSALYLPLFAVSAALDAGTGEDVYWVSDVVSGLIVLLQAIFVIGLRVLGQKMSDPYGEDVEDLSVIHYVTFTWKMSSRIMEAENPEALSASEEENICRERRHIGEAWEDPAETDMEVSKLGMESVQDDLLDEGTVAGGCSVQ